ESSNCPSPSKKVSHPVSIGSTQRRSIGVVCKPQGAQPTLKSWTRTMTANPSLPPGTWHSSCPPVPPMPISSGSGESSPYHGQPPSSPTSVAQKSPGHFLQSDARAHAPPECGCWGRKSVFPCPSRHLPTIKESRPLLAPPRSGLGQS
ncbi:hypothetical protein CLAIMM_09995, partial [Cladophialophora immunda]